ncbi:MAG: hypothetical protein [Bacteriophage sp.]|nr:MAG: hypothetical protein [Bacteriophage sp.]
MTKRKAVTISVTSNEFEAISNAFAEYIDKIESGADDDYINDVRKDSAHFTSFKQKYLRAVRIKERGTARNKLIKRAVALALVKGTEDDK